MKKFLTWLPMIALVSLALAIRNHLPPWILTWTLILFFIFGFKWVFFWRYVSEAHRKIAMWRVPCYFFLWVGLDPENFLNPQYKAARPPIRMWLYPFLNLVLSILFFFVIPRHLPLQHVWLIGWSAMMGLLVFVYFVLTHALALMWQSFGVDAKHLMHMPIAARSLSRFWHVTWNTAYHRLIYTFVYKPTHAWAGKLGSLYLSFLVSGLLHELVFSYPYKGGYGLPTLFFMIQAVGITIERSPLGKKIKMRGAGSWGRVYVYLFTIPSSMFLFHIALIRGGVLPCLRALHVLP
jgi:hypothetical protein